MFSHLKGYPVNTVDHLGLQQVERFYQSVQLYPAYFCTQPKNHGGKENETSYLVKFWYLEKNVDTNRAFCTCRGG